LRLLIAVWPGDAMLRKSALQVREAAFEIAAGRSAMGVAISACGRRSLT
jgi:hypothetical protein